MILVIKSLYFIDHENVFGNRKRKLKRTTKQQNNIWNWMNDSGIIKIAPIKLKSLRETVGKASAATNSMDLQ